MEDEVLSSLSATAVGGESSFAVRAPVGCESLRKEAHALSSSVAVCGVFG